jgi:Uma2 family endonuclease
MSEVIAGRPAVTWDEFVRLPDDDRRELIDGVLLEVDVPGFRHEHVVVKLLSRLDAWTEAHGGILLGSGYKVRISRTRGVMPDVQLYRASNPAKPGEAGLTSGHPDLAVEVISPTSPRYDRGLKKRWYAEVGVPEYWILDPEARTLERYVLTGDSYGVPQVLAGDDVLRPASFEGLEIRLQDLWREPLR